LKTGVLETSGFHVVQGGTDNGDKAALERASALGRRLKGWVLPKATQAGDEVVIYVRGHGLFATARACRDARPRPDWPNRYGAPLEDVRLIEPPISLAALQAAVPALKWTRYPRSITTPTPVLAGQMRKLIKERKRRRLPERLDEEFLRQASLEELRAVALLSSKPSLPGVGVRTIQRARSEAIRRYVLTRADGYCEGCQEPAPFNDREGKPFLEPHHTTRVADGGPDHPRNVIALCPNCHRRVHHSADGKAFNERLRSRLRRIESRDA